MQRLGMLKHLSLAAAFAAMALTACGDDDNPAIDASLRDAPVTGVDARVVDAGATTDARGTDGGAQVATHSGTIAVHEVSIVSPPIPGNGQQIAISFSANGAPNAGSFSTPVIPGVSCTATLVDTLIPAQNNPDLNEGTVKVEIKEGGATATFVPDCTFSTASSEYTCPSGGGASGTTTAGSNNVFTFTNTTASGTPFSAGQVGATLVALDGPAAGGAWGITGVNALTAGLQSLGTNPPATFGMFAVLHGTGLPVSLTSNVDGTSPGPAPQFIADTNTVKVSLTKGGMNHFETFATTDVGAGDAFVLNNATNTLLTNGIDLETTTPVAISCDGAGGTCGVASITVVNIETTDDATLPANPTDLGTPARFRASITCPAFGNTVTLQPGHIAILNQANPTRIRVSVFRDGIVGQLCTTISPTCPNPTNVVGGHGLVYFHDY